MTGHPRTPWCIAFHPTSNDILASGCLGGQVRVWDLSVSIIYHFIRARKEILNDKFQGGSEVWICKSQVASLSFHPVQRLLVIATHNEVHFWDWNQSTPFAVTSTKSNKEKVRYLVDKFINLSFCPHLSYKMTFTTHWRFLRKNRNHLKEIFCETHLWDPVRLSSLKLPKYQSKDEYFSCGNFYFKHSNVNGTKLRNTYKIPI